MTDDSSQQTIRSSIHQYHQQARLWYVKDIGEQLDDKMRSATFWGSVDKKSTPRILTDICSYPDKQKVDGISIQKDYER